MLKVAVETNTTALPSNFSQIMPRYGSFENVVITVVAGFCRYGPRLRKSVAPSRVVFIKFCALGLTIMARIQGSLKRSPTRTTLTLVVLGATTDDGRSSKRLTAMVVSGGATGAARDVTGPMGRVRAVAIGVGCAA